jgi:hypothetical protein
VSEDRGNLGSVAVGVGMGVAFTVMGVGLGIILASAFSRLVMLVGIGIVQLLWMLPAWLIYRRRGQTETAKGILITAGVVFLLNASCWGLVFSSKFKIGG